MARWLLCLCLLLAGGEAAAEGLLLLDHLSHASSARSAQPSIAVDPREGFVLTWQERDADGATLKFTVIDRAGVEQRHGEIARGGDWFVNGADFPNLAVLENGDWISFWLQKTAPDTYAYEIRMVRSRDAGRTWDEAIVIHRDRTDTEHGFVTLTAAGGDRVRAVWLDGRQMAASGKPADHAQHGIERMSLRTAVFDRSGTASDERELDALTCACCQTDAARSGGRTLHAYRDRTEAEVRDIHLLLEDGGQWRPARPIHDDGWVIAACPVNGPAVAARGDRFAVLWPTMASGEMQLQLAFGDGESFSAPVTLAAGANELGRLDLVGWATQHWLATRIATVDGLPQLRLDLIDDDGSVLETHDIARRVGGFPRIATLDGVALLGWAEAGDAPGQSRIGLARIRSSTPVPAALSP